jgi:hypothetical protein
MVGAIPDQGTGHGMTPHEIYVKVTTGLGPDSLHAAKDATQLEAQAEAERTTLITDLSKMIGNGWEGSASEAAYRVTKPLVDTGQQRTEHLGNAYGYLQDQLAAFADVKNKVKPVSATPPPTNVLVEAEPWLADLDHTTKNYQNDSQHNIVAFTAYDSASKTNGGNLPREYPTLKDPGNGPEVVLNDHKTESASSGSGTGTGTSHSHGGSGVPPVPGGSAATHSNGQSTPPPTGHPVVQGPQVPPGSTSTSSAAPPPVYQPGTGGYPQAPAAQGPTTGVPYQPLGPYGGTGYGSGPRYGGSSGYGGGSGYGGASGAGGSGARTGWTPEGGPRSGAGAGAIPAEESIARRLNPGATRGGMSGMSGIGAGHGADKDEDTEHERPSFLQEDDPEDIFGTDEVTAPSVIE